MATIPRPAPLPAPTNIPGTRSGPSTRVSSLGGATVEDLPGSAGVSFDSAAFGFREDADATFGRNHGEGGQQQHPGFIDAPTQAFAAMLEGAEIPKTQDNQSETGSDGSVPFVGLTAKAIEIYETNAKVLSGDIALRGTSFSVVL